MATGTVPEAGVTAPASRLPFFFFLPRSASVGARRISLDERNQWQYGAAFLVDEQRPPGGERIRSHALYADVQRIWRREELTPFLSSLGLFVLSFIGIGISFYPYIVPQTLSIWDAAAPRESLGFLLIGAVVLIPIIVAYTAYAYWVFRGKVGTEGYH